MGAHLTMLRRVQVGELTIEQASSVTELAGCVRAGEELPIIPLVRAAERILPASVRVSDDQAAALRHGQFIEPTERPQAFPVALIHQDLRASEAPSIAEGLVAAGDLAGTEKTRVTKCLGIADDVDEKAAELVAIGKKRGKLVAPEVVFPLA